MTKQIAKLSTTDTPLNWVLKRLYYSSRRHFENTSDSMAGAGACETYLKVQWRCLYRVVDKPGNTVDFLFLAQRERPIVILQTKYLNNILEQDYRAINRRPRPDAQVQKLSFCLYNCRED